MNERKNRRNSIFWIFLSLSLIWMIGIFFFSAQPAVESAELSTGTVHWLLSCFSELALLRDLEGRGILEFIVRKSAHMAEYGILAICFGVTIFCSMRWSRKWQWKTGVLCCLYACSDEFHQLFVPGRSGQIRDVAIDMIGVCCSIFILWGFLRRMEKS